MKRLILSLLVLIGTLNIYSQVSVGTPVKFPDNIFLALAYKPALTFIKSDDGVGLLLFYTRDDYYASFDEESVILLKFEDETIEKLPIYQPVYVHESYDSQYDSSLKSISHLYTTTVRFEISPEITERIVTRNEKIVKIRVLFSNGKVKDWDIKKSYRSKLTKKLVKSYKEANQNYIIQKENIDNVENNF